MAFDDQIRERAKLYSERLNSVADRASKEEEIRIASEREIAFIQEETGITLEGKHEFTVASGRIDSVYDRVIIEYKNPSSAGAKIGPGPDSPGTKKVVAQIKSRFQDLFVEHGQAFKSLFGVGLDGKYFVFVRFRDNKWSVLDPVPVTPHSAERFLWALFNLGTSGKPFSPDELAKDFGSEASMARSGVKGLYGYFCPTPQKGKIGDPPPRGVAVEGWPIPSRKRRIVRRRRRNLQELLNDQVFHSHK